MYAFFAYALTGQMHPLFYFMNTIFLLAAFMFFEPLDDYLDVHLNQEENFISYLFKERNASKRRVFTLIFLPLIVVLSGIYFFFSNKFYYSGIFYLVGLFTVVFYALPPVRIKGRKIIGFLSAPFIAVVIFLQSYLLVRPFTLPLLFVLSYIVLFQSFAEAISVIDEPRQRKGWFDKKRAIPLMQILPKITFVVSLVFALFRPVFIVFAVASIIQWVSVRRLNVDNRNFYFQRRNILSPLLSLYGFMTLAILGIMGRLHI